MKYSKLHFKNRTRVVATCFCVRFGSKRASMMMMIERPLISKQEPNAKQELRAPKNR